MSVAPREFPSVAVIPARGGSQRVPGKNIRPANGTPALARVISLCHDSGVFDRVVVSTDSTDVAHVALDAGAEVPFDRPEGLADAHTGILQVVKHTVRELALPSRAAVGCVYATAFTLDPRDLIRAREVLDGSQDEAFVVSVTTFDYPIQRALQMEPNGQLSMLDAEKANTRSQDLPNRWHDAGQFICGSAATWLSSTSVWSKAIGQPVAHWRAIDIDTEEDWQHAEIIVRAIESHSSDR